MSNTYDTSALPLGTTSPKALYNNASNFDEAMNSDGPSWVDRFGKRRETWTGMQVLVSDYLAAMGFEAAHLTYVDGSPLTVLRPTQLIDRAGFVYKVKQPASFPVNLTGNWTTDAPLLSDVTDSAIRALLAQPDGSYYVGFIQSGTGAVARTSLSKMRDFVSILDFGGVGDGVTDNHAAMLAAHAAHGDVVYPPGIYLCSGAVPVNAPFGIAGAGINKTIIRFTAATDGFIVTQNLSTDGINVRGLSIQTSQVSTSTTGLRIDGTPQLGPVTATPYRIIQDRTTLRATIRDVDFRGTLESHGWGVNLHLKSVMNFSLYNIGFRGLIPAIVGNLQGVGILINGDGVPVDFSIDRVWGFYTLYGILMPDYIEGGHIRNYELVAVIYGIMGRYTAAYSTLPEAACGCLAMYLNDGHLNVLQAGIILANTNQTHVRDQNIYLQPRAADGPALGLQITNGNYNSLDSIFVSGDQAANAKPNNLGVVLTSIGLSAVQDVKVSSLGSGVTLQSATNNTVRDVISTFSVSVVTGDVASTGNTVSGRGISLGGVLFSLSNDNVVDMQQWAAVRAQAVAAGSSATITVALPGGIFSEAPTFADLVFTSSSINYEWLYQRSSSSAMTAVFLIKPAYPATSLPAETVGFGVSVKGI